MKTICHSPLLCRLATPLAAAACLFLAPLTHAFRFAPAGPEFQVHTTTVGAQGGPQVAMDANGNFITVWFSATYAPATAGGFAQRFDSSGNPVGAEFKFGDNYSVSGSGFSVDMAPDGRFVIAHSNGHEIIAKRYDAAGNELPPPAGIPRELGNAFYVRSGPPFAASGPSRFRPRVAMDVNANFVIAWEDRTGQDGDGFGIFAKRYDAAGNEMALPAGMQGTGVGNEFQVNSFTGHRQMTPDVAMNASGDFIITWWSFLQDGGFDAVMAKRYDATGNEVVPAPETRGCGAGNEFQANTFKQEWSPYAPGGAGHPPHVAMDALRNFVITWDGSPIPNTNPSGQDCSSSGVFAKRYSASGNELPPPPGTQGNGIGNEFQVNSQGLGAQGPHDVSMTPDGLFVIAWYDNRAPLSSVLAKVYDAAGNAVVPPAGAQGRGLCNEFEATTYTSEGFPAVAIDPNGNFVIAWDEPFGADGDFSAVGLSPSGVFARRYLASTGPTPIRPLTHEPVLECPAELTVNAEGAGQAIVPDLRSQAVMTGVCAPCASITVTQNPVPGTLVSCGSHPITLTLNDSAGHTASCATMFNVVDPAHSVNVVLRVVDQHGQEIPGSRIGLFPGEVSTGDSVLLPEGLQFFSVAPGIQGHGGSGTLLYRMDQRTVTCATTELRFEWITSSLTARLKDQHGVDIPASKYDLTLGIGTNTGDPVILPITDEDVYPTMNGGFKGGYFIGLIPGLRGTPGSSTELFRAAEGPFELTTSPAEVVFEWITSTYTVRLKDQHGVDIPDSMFSAPGTPNTLGMGEIVTLPITDETVYPNIGGFYKDGYFTALAPGLNGNPGDGTWLYRYESNLELGSQPTEFVFEWIQHTCPLEVQSSVNVPVPGSDLVLPPLFPDYVPGQPVTLPVNDAVTYPSLGGYYASSQLGYWITVTPGDVAPASSEVYFTLSAEGGLAPSSFSIGGHVYSLALACADGCEPPVLASLTAPAAPLTLGTTTTITAQFVAADHGSGRVCAFNWGDGTSDLGLDASAATCSASHTYAAPGVYRVTVTASNDCGETDTAVHEFIVVYDPAGGFVTGGGWINSPAGAYAADTSLTGRANFGFVAKYQQGATVPTGHTEFQFKAGNLNFKSTHCDWLVVAGAKAKYKGSGTINGTGDYAFHLSATDGQANGGGGADKFRIKIWHSAGGGVIYDNQPGAPDDADATTTLGGGSIVIHKR